MATALDKIKKYRKSQQSNLNFLNNDSTALEKIQNYKLENNLNEQNTITNKTKPIVNNKINSDKISNNNIFTQKNLLNNNKTSNFKEKKDSLNGLKPIEELSNNQLINIAKMRDEVENTDKNTKEAINMLESSKKVDDKKARKEVLSQFAVTPLLALKGASQKLEGAYDTMYDLSSKINEGLLNKIGVISDEEYNKRREQARNYVADNKTENFYNKYNLNDTLEKGEQHSIVKRDNLLGKTAVGVGGMLPTILLSSAVGVPSYNPTKASSLKGLIKNIGTHALINAPTNVTFGTSAYGNALAEAYNAGASDEEATKYAISSTAVEIASEWITGGIPGTNGVGGLDILVDKGIDKISNQLVKKLVNYGYKMVGEGVEEAIAEILNPILKNATYSSGNEIDWKSVIESAIVGGLTAGVLEAPNMVSNISNDIRQNNNSNNKLATVNDVVKQENSTNNVILPTVNNFAKNNTNETNNIFSKQVDEVIEGIYPKRDMLIVSENTPKILQEIGLNNLPITMTQKHLYTITNKDGKYNKANYHDIDINVIKQLPQALENPLNILKSSTKDDSIVVITELADKNDNIIVASIKIDGKGQINDIAIDSNVLTSAYGKNNYDRFMQENIKKGNLLYDIDDGIIKKTNTPRLELPNDISSRKTDVTDRVQFPMRNSSNNTSDIPKNTSPFSFANNIPQLNQNVKSDTLSTNNNMQNNQNNAINVPPVEKKAKTSKKSKQIAKILNETIKGDTLEVKQRKWIETSLDSDVVKDKVLLEDLDFNTISYVVQSNKKTLDKANNKLDSMGYDTSVKYIQSKINDNDISLTDIALAERLIQEAIKQGDTSLASELIMDTAIIGTDLGQKVQALSLIQRLTPEGQLKFYQKLVIRAKVKGDKSFQNVEITPEMVELILNAYNSDGTFDQNDLNDRVEQFKGKIAEQLVTTKSEKLVAWRYLSMLGNPKTHIRNIVSNIAMWGTLKVKNATARTLETILPVKNRTKTWEKASDVVSDFAKKTTDEMKNIITGEGKYNEKTSIESQKQTFKNKTLEKIKDFNSDLLSKEDWIFSKNAFENTFKEYLTANGIKTENDITNNSEIIEKAKLYALEQAEIATFRQYSWLASQISKIENKNALTKVAVGSTIPFKKTPINIAKTGVKYSPIGLINSISYDAYQVSKGNMEASQMIDNLSQGLVGSSLALIGYALAKSGILKGAGDDDKEGKYDSYLGNQTYSVKIGDATYSISWLSPVAMPLLVGATAYEKLEEQSDWDMNIVIDTLAQTLDPLSEMSFLSSLDDVLSSYDNGVKKIAGMVGSMGQNYLTQFIPTLVSQFASTTDDKKRTTRASNNSSFKYGEETVRKLMYKIPILRNQLEVSTDIWGNEINQSDNIIERAIENFIAPYSKKEDITTSLDIELKRIYNSTGEISVIPGVPKAFVKYDDVTYKMSASEYTQYKKTYGQIANNYLSSLINNVNYKNSTDEEKVKMIKEIYSFASALANEEYFEKKDVEYETDLLKEIKKIKELNMTNTQIAEYVAQKKIISSIKSNEDLTSSEKKKEISEYLINAKLNDKQLAYLYDKYYSSEKVLDSLLSANIPIKEFIKFNSQEFTTDYYDNGKAITNSRKNKVINYVNNLNLTIPQKAMLIKLEYSSYTGYDNQIVNYINNMKYSKFEKASILKSFGFDNYDKYLIDYVNKMPKTKEEKAEILEELGFKVRNGKVYAK